MNALAAKLWAMGLSAFLTALGGTFYAQSFSFSDPTLTFGEGTVTLSRRGADLLTREDVRKAYLGL